MGDKDGSTKKEKKVSYSRRNKSMDYRGASVMDSVNLKKMIENGNLEGIKFILEKQNSALSSIDSDGQSLLHYACEFGYPEIAKYLLSKGLDVNAKNKFGWTPIILSVYHGHFPVALVLCQQESIDMSPKIPNSERNVLHFLGRQWEEEIVPTILRKCSPLILNATDHHGDTPLHRTCIHCNLDCAKSLLSFNAHVNVQNSHGETPLHYASRAGVPELVQLLLDYGADPSIKGKYGTYEEVAYNPTSGEKSKFLSPTTLSHSISDSLVSPTFLTPPPPTFSVSPPTLSVSPPNLSVSPPTLSVSPPPIDSIHSSSAPLQIVLNNIENKEPTLSLADESTTEISTTDMNSNISNVSNNYIPNLEGTVVTSTAISTVATTSNNGIITKINATNTNLNVGIPVEFEDVKTQKEKSKEKLGMAGAVGAVGAVVSEVLASSGNQNFSVKGTVKKIVEGILSQDMEFANFDTKKLFKKMVMVTNFKDILVREIIPQLKHKLLNSVLPAIAGATDTPVGEIQYEIWKLSLSNLSFDDKSITCEPGLSGLKEDVLSIEKYTLEIFSFTYKGVDIENKQPKLNIKECQVEMEHLNLDIHKTKAKWLYNAIISIISNRVKNQISQLLTVNLTQQLNVLEGAFNEKLAVLWEKITSKKAKKENNTQAEQLMKEGEQNVLALREEVLKLQAEIAKTKLEVLRLQLPPPKASSLKCFYYPAKAPTEPLIIMIDTKHVKTIAELQSNITDEFQSVDSHTFPSHPQIKNIFKHIFKNYNTDSLPSSPSPSPLPSPSSPIPPSPFPSPSSPITVVTSSVTTTTQPRKLIIEWKFKDNDGDMVYISKRNSIDNIQAFAKSIHIFEKVVFD